MPERPGGLDRAHRARRGPFGPEGPTCLRRSRGHGLVQPWGTIHTMLFFVQVGPGPWGLPVTRKRHIVEGTLATLKPKFGHRAPPGTTQDDQRAVLPIITPSVDSSLCVVWDFLEGDVNARRFFYHCITMATSCTALDTNEQSPC